MNMLADLRPARIDDFAAFFSGVLRRRSTCKISFASGDTAYFVGGSDRLGRAEARSLIREYRYRVRNERMIRQFQISDQQCAKFYPTIDDDWVSRHSAWKRAAPTGPADIAVYAHLFHKDLWPDFDFALADCPVSFDLHVSLAAQEPALRREILDRYPQTTFHDVENRGRDIWPFVSLLRSGVFDPYTAVCKLHSKKSDQGRSPMRSSACSISLR